MAVSLSPSYLAFADEASQIVGVSATAQTDLPFEDAATDGAATDGAAATQDAAVSDGAAATDGTADADRALSVQSAEEATGLDASSEGTAYAAGEVLVAFEDGTTAAKATQVVESTNTVATKEVSDDDLVASSVSDGTLVSDTGGEAIARVDVDEGATVVEAVAEVEQQEGVAYAQPNYVYTICDESADMDGVAGESADTGDTVGEDGATGTATAKQAEAAEELETFSNTLTEQSTTIDDPYASRQWQLAASSSYGVGCYTAWDYARCDGAVSVAIIDTGCNVDHEDLDDNIVGAYNAVSDSVDVTDTKGHGTHVAGIVAAETNNDTGVSGVSYNANIVPIKAMRSDGMFYSDGLIASYAYLLKDASSDIDGDGTIETVAQEYNVRVVNMSLGGKGECRSDDAVLKQVDAANTAGILTVCAAGNSETNLSVPYAEYPGDYATCLSVINITSSGTRSASSNYNVTGVTEGDFGKNISALGNYIYSTLTSGRYGYMGGTSMASPVVAGVAALVFSADETLTPAECKQVLYDTAADLGTSGWDREYGYGEVDATAAVKEATGGAELIVSERCSISPTSATYTGSAATPTVTVTNAAGTTLAAGTDYTVSYADADGNAVSSPTDAGTYTVTITGTRSTGMDTSYYGTVEETFTIEAASISAASVVLSQTSYEYTGAAVEPVSSVTLGGATLAAGTDYTVSYADADGNAVAAPTSAGTYAVMVTGTGNYTGSAARKTFTVEPTVTRLSGSIALGTMTSIVDTGWEDGSCSTVIVATMDGYWDALSASALAGLDGIDCPVLITSGTSLSDQTSAEIGRLGASKVYIAGGTAAVSEGVEDAIRALGGVKGVERLSGDNAVGTSLAIYGAGAAAGAGGASAWGTTCIVATNDGYWDALAASPYACSQHAPIFLYDAGAGQLDASVVDAIRAGGFTRVIICGGTAAVPGTVEGQLSGIGPSGTGVVDRYGGGTAVETSALIAEACVATKAGDNGAGIPAMGADGVAVATVDGYWDALTGAALCGRNDSPLVLASDADRSAITRFVAGHKADISRAYVFGGTAAVSAGTYDAVANALK